MPKEARTVEQLKAKIEEHTGRVPVTNDHDKLTAKLAELEQRKADGRAAERDYASSADPTVILTVSMHKSAKAATVRIAGGERMPVSQLVRTALHEFAQKRGYKDELQHLVEED